MTIENLYRMAVKRGVQHLQIRVAVDITSRQYHADSMASIYTQAVPGDGNTVCELANVAMEEQDVNIEATES